MTLKLNLKIEKQLPKSQRQLSTLKKGNQKQTPLVSNDTNGNHNDNRATAKVAKNIGVSTTTFERAKKVIENRSNYCENFYSQDNHKDTSARMKHKYYNSL